MSDILLNTFPFRASQIREENPDNKLAIKIQQRCSKGMYVASWEDRKDSILKVAVGGNLSLSKGHDLT